MHALVDKGSILVSVGDGDVDVAEASPRALLALRGSTVVAAPETTSRSARTSRGPR
jgi:hypothetical protein